ncbi:hypothetical protein CK203_085434 [Vitis vinifera]|uniref:Uncharacterized protein n=1 Tax=Vitis vinifera TaxID=29760 RepID=A0A438BUS3_VITVI|nr:hypothetical protein CK203_085434 [Vitis vinifera]
MSEELHKASDQLQFFHELVTRLNNIIRGFEVQLHERMPSYGDKISPMTNLEDVSYGFLFQADVSELWYVEEYDVLALALNGRMKVRRFKLAASKSETSEDHKVEGKA